MPVAVISGGGTGIGYAIARALAQDGYDLTLIGRRADVLHAAARRLDGYVEVLPADLTQPDDVEQAAASLAKVDVLVNNAGAVPVQPGPSLADVADWWLANFNANVLSAALLTEALTPKLTADASVVFLSSIAAQRGGRGPYSAAKAALHGYAASLARDLAPVTVNVIAPGYVEGTDLFERPPTDAETRRRLGETLTGRVGTPADVAETVRWLARARHVTGQVISINGGAVFGR
jgi:3-oxoacyl-[acyl-carrier protein] reductase